MVGNRRIIENIMKYIQLEHISSLYNGYMKPFDVNGESLLLIQQNDNVYIIENKCGHFGVPLDSGCLDNESIICSQHGFAFNLNTGRVIDRPYENCDVIKVFKVRKQGDFIGLEL
jgi:nitrite reductase/ring-hydroxylating ferredoxin subunit